jgi:hypothetical protein
MGENSNPEFTLALKMAGNGNASSFNLLTGHGTARERLQAEFTEGESVAALGIASAGAFHRLTVFSAGG